MENTGRSNGQPPKQLQYHCTATVHPFTLHPNNNTLLQAGLILATTAVFITSQPPRDTWNYSQTLANCLCIFALSHSLMSIWFGTFVIVVYQATTCEWALKVIAVLDLSKPCS